MGQWRKQNLQVIRNIEMNLDPEFLDTLSMDELYALNLEAQQVVNEAQDKVHELGAYITKRTKVQAINEIMSKFTPEELEMAKKLAQTASVDGIETQSATGWD